MIGRALVKYLRLSGQIVDETTRRVETTLPGRIFLDLTRNVSEWPPPKRYDVAYLCAAISSLEQCRINPEESLAVNVYNTFLLAQKLIDTGAFFIFLSTNLVYDGSCAFRSADDAVCPQTEYGRQKADAEKLLLNLGEHVAIVRLTKVLNPTMPLFTDWIESLRNGTPIHPFSDMVMAPVALAFVVHALHAIAAYRLSGIIQVSGQQDLTYEQVARHIAKKLGVSLELIQPMSIKESTIHCENIPQHTTLDTTRLSQELGIDPPDVWSTIDSVFGV